MPSGLDSAVMSMIADPHNIKYAQTLHPPPIYNCSSSNKVLFTLFNKKLKTQYSLYTPMYRHVVLLATTDP